MFLAKSLVLDNSFEMFLVMELTEFPKSGKLNAESIDSLMLPKVDFTESAKDSYASASFCSLSSSVFQAFSCASASSLAAFSCAASCSLAACCCATSCYLAACSCAAFAAAAF